LRDLLLTFPKKVRDSTELYTYYRETILAIDSYINYTYLYFE